MKIVAISDTHMWDMPIDALPDGDVLVHAGDATYRGRYSEVKEFSEELGKHANRYKHIVFVPGNHDWGFDLNEREFRKFFEDYPNIHVLINQEVVIDGVKFWGSPVCPPFGNWAFYLDDNKRELLWNNMMPDDVDVLITHGPPKGILDEVVNWNGKVEQTGCEFLAQRVLKVGPKVHIFGHIHEGHGILDFYSVKFINASIMNAAYKPVNKPITTEI